MPQRLDPSDPRECLNSPWDKSHRAGRSRARLSGSNPSPSRDRQGAAGGNYFHRLLSIPGQVWEAKKLTPYAFEARYPAVAREVTEAQHAEALRIAEAVVCWVESIILGKCPEFG